MSYTCFCLRENFTMADGDGSPLIQVEREPEEADINSEVEDGPDSVEQPSRMRTRYLVVLCILFVELCERLTFYGVAANLVFYCKDILKLTSPLPSTITLAFQGIICVFQKHFN